MRDPLRAMASIVLSAVLALLPFSAASRAAERCLDQREIVRTATARIPQARISMLAGDEATGFLAAYNAYPPRSDLSGDAVMIIDAGPGTPAVFAILFTGGCASSGGRIARQTYDVILAQLARAKA